MRKSNLIIAAVLLLASVAFLWIWHALQFDLVDNPLDIVVTVVWWVVIAAACVAIHWAEKKRQERIRTIFVAPGLLYNSEMGVVRLSPDDEVVDALAGDSLELLPTGSSWPSCRPTRGCASSASCIPRSSAMRGPPGRGTLWKSHAPIAPGSSTIATSWPLLVRGAIIAGFSEGVPL